MSSFNLDAPVPWKLLRLAAKEGVRVTEVSPSEALHRMRELFATLRERPDDARDDESIYELERYLASRCYVLAVEIDAFDAVALRHGATTARRAAAAVKRAFRPLFDAESLVATSSVLGRWEVDTMFPDDASAVAKAVELCTVVAATPLDLDDGARAFTASVGVSCEREFPATQYLSPFRKCQDVARERLRRAQSEGGGRVYAFG